MRSEEGATAQSLRLEDVFSRRLATLNPDARWLLEFACIAGNPLSVAVARHAAKLKAGNLSGNQVYNRIRGLKWTPRAEAEISADAMAQAQIALTVGTTLSNVDTLRANAVLDRGLRLALNLGEPSVVVQATVVASCMASALNQKERAQALLEVAEQAARLDGSLHSKGMAKAAREFLAFFVENEWRKTPRLGDEVLELFWAAGRGRFWERDACLLYRCFGLMYLGELTQLSEDVSQFFQSAVRSGNRLLGVSLRAGFRIRHLARDNLDAADAWMAAQGVMRPDRMTAMLVPGWAYPGPDLV